MYVRSPKASKELNVYGNMWSKEVYIRAKGLSAGKFQNGLVKLYLRRLSIKVLVMRLVEIKGEETSVSRVCN